MSTRFSKSNKSVIGKVWKLYNWIKCDTRYSQKRPFFFLLFMNVSVLWRIGSSSFNLLQCNMQDIFESIDQWFCLCIIIWLISYNNMIYIIRFILKLPKLETEQKEELLLWMLISQNANTITVRLSVETGNLIL